MSVVLKLGGSLLTQTDWCQRLSKFIQSQPIDDYVMIVGGGEMIDALRRLDQVHRLAPKAMHWRCIECLTATADIAVELLQRNFTYCQICRLNNEIEFQSFSINQSRPFKQTASRLIVTTVSSFYRESINDAVGVSSGLTLPAIGWETTSDAIAIFLATIIHASECILLKSCQVPNEFSIQAAARAGVVDGEAVRLSSYSSPVRIISI